MSIRGFYFLSWYFRRVVRVWQPFGIAWAVAAGGGCRQSTRLWLGAAALALGTTGAAVADPQVEDLDAAKREIADLRAQLEKAQGDLARQLEAVLSDGGWDTDPEVLVLRGKLEAARRDINAREKRAKVAEARVQAQILRLEEAQAEIRDLTARAAKASEEHAERLAERGEDVERLKGLIAMSEEARTQLGEELRAAKARQNAWIVRFDEARARTEAVKADKTALQGVLEGRAAAIEDLGGQLKQGAEARKALLDQLSEAKAKNDQWAERLVKANEAATAAAAEAEALRGDLQARQSEISTLSLRLRGAESKTGRSVILQEDLAQARTRIAALEGVRATLKEERDRLQAKLEKTEARLETVTDQEAAASAKDDELAEVTKALAARDEELEALKAEFRASQETRKRLSAELSQTLTELRRLSGAGKSADRETSEAEALRRKLDVSKRELTLVQRELELAQSDIGEARREIAKRIERLILAASVGPEDLSVSQLQEQLREAQAEIDRLTANLAKQEAKSPGRQDY